ncbi:hypothetical protein C8R46DRAFT_1234614 [Mycena filopes]|nr:hypothetical protein C8R46DRAFT_1234614 [Mycena filopes]
MGTRLHEGTGEIRASLDEDMLGPCLFIILPDISSCPLDLGPCWGARTERQLASNHTHTPSTPTTPSSVYDRDDSLCLRRLHLHSNTALRVHSRPTWRRTTTTLDLQAPQDLGNNRRQTHCDQLLLLPEVVVGYSHRRRRRLPTSPSSSGSAHLHLYACGARLPVVCGRTRPPTPPPGTSTTDIYYSCGLLRFAYPSDLLRTERAQECTRIQWRPRVAPFKRILEDSVAAVCTRICTRQVQTGLGECHRSILRLRPLIDLRSSSLAALKACCKAVMEWPASDADRQPSAAGGHAQLARIVTTPHVGQPKTQARIRGNADDIYDRLLTRGLVVESRMLMQVDSLAYYFLATEGAYDHSTTFYRP